MATLETLASKLAEDTIAAMAETGEDRLFVEVGTLLAASSQSLEEAYMTEVSIRLAGRAAQEFLERKRDSARSG